MNAGQQVSDPQARGRGQEAEAGAHRVRPTRRHVDEGWQLSGIPGDTKVRPANTWTRGAWHRISVDRPSGRPANTWTRGTFDLDKPDADCPTRKHVDEGPCIPPRIRVIRIIRIA